MIPYTCPKFCLTWLNFCQKFASMAQKKSSLIAVILFHLNVAQNRMQFARLSKSNCKFTLLHVAHFVPLREHC